jgi:hypothetical protein
MQTSRLWYKRYAVVVLVLLALIVLFDLFTKYFS